MPTPYVLYADMAARLPLDFLVQALDDNGDGAVDPGLWDQVAAAVAKEIDGILGVRFNVPFVNPIPAPVVTAAEVLAAELLYGRRGFQGEEKNPWAAQAKTQRTTLAKIAAGEVPLGPTNNRAKPSASIVSEPSKSSSRRGATAV
jgi:phage gp36-like protein